MPEKTLVEQLVNELSILVYSSKEYANEIERLKQRIAELEIQLEADKNKFSESLTLFNKTHANVNLIASWAFINANKLDEEAKRELVKLLQNNA